MSAHTPGPWSLETVVTSSGICHKIGPFPWRGDKQNHACIYVDYPGKGPFEVELLANANLIAAAPETAAERDRLKEVNVEMLEVLKLANRELIFMRGPRESVHFADATLKAVQAAIAKAESIPAT